MKITGIRFYQVPLTSHVSYYMSDGKACETVTTTVVEIETSEGLVGWGEVCPIPHYLEAYAGGVGPAVEEMWPILRGADPIGPDAVMARLDTHLPGHRYAKSAIDIALWDLTGKAANLPVYVLLGGRQTGQLPLYHSITCVDPDEMSRIAADAHAAGMTQFQVKLGADHDNAADIERLRRVRETVGPGPLVYGDWNCGTTKLDAIRVGRAVAELDIMLEQPCQTIADCAAVRSATGLPLKLDEAAHDTKTLLEGQALGCLDAVALKLSKFGGLGPLRRARDLCLHLGAKMCIEDTWGSDIATAAALHLATSTPAGRILNVCDLSGYVGPRIDPAAPVRAGGFISAPDGPGLGITPDRDILSEPILVLD